ncbi:oligopeptide/dipeptide ABC transporter ATP-binding protein, partial [Streptomyces sp. URMC 125]|uniref:oligopeptide/dipeptide ABC transporter ATP-binding protein n=1 Tax=Streptomyces sp. URMC 125 TaxID=3423419 RepID=UPI003F19EF71
TRGLLDSIPRLDRKGRELYAIKGLPPNMAEVPPGCAFSPRCPRAREVCRAEVPPLYRVTGDGTGGTGGSPRSGRRASACHFWEETVRG